MAKGYFTFGVGLFLAVIKYLSTAVSLLATNDLDNNDRKSIS